MEIFWALEPECLPPMVKYAREEEQLMNDSAASGGVSDYSKQLSNQFKGLDKIS